MCIKKPLFLIFILSLVILTALFTIIPEKPTYAKGVAKSEGSGSRSSNHSDNRSGDSNDQGQIKGHVNPNSVVRSENPSVISEQREVKIVTQKGAYRKDYEDIGKIWQERQEQRNNPGDNNRTHKDNDNHVNVNIIYPGKYSYYRYDYVPGYSYPSVYCFYYGYFPPYIQNQRIVYVYHDPQTCYSYIDLPRIIIDDPWERDDHYPYYYEHRNLSSALRDIRHAWEQSNVSFLMDHVRRNSQIDVYLKGEYAYSLDKQDYYDMTRDAMSSIKTADFDFYRIRQRNSSDAVAYGKHIYYDDWDDNNYYYYYRQPSCKITLYVSYTLKRYGNEWYITEVDCSPYKLD